MSTAVQAQPKPGIEAISYVRADDPAYRDRLFRLRHDCYVRDGITEPTPCGRMHDRYDDLPNAHLFGVEIEGELVASLRLHICNLAHRMSPSHNSFADILDPILDRGESYVDPTRFVVAKRLANATFLAVATIRVAAMAAEHFDVDHVLATPRAEHVSFYRRFCCMQALAAPRAYPPLTRKLGLMSGRRTEISDRVISQRSIFGSTQEDRDRLFGASGPIDLAA